MAVLRIPLDPTVPAFSFFTELESISYQFNFRWNSRIESWIFDIYDDTQTAVQLGVPYDLDVVLLKQNVRDNRPPGDFAGLSSEGTIYASRFDLGVENRFLYNESEDA
jgi:hypothetical protein